MIFGILLSLYLQSCASFSMGRRCDCETITLPSVPSVDSCVATGNGTCFVCNSQGCREYSTMNMTCRPPEQDASIFIWIRDAVRAVGQ